MFRTSILVVATATVIGAAQVFTDDGSLVLDGQGVKVVLRDENGAVTDTDTVAIGSSVKAVSDGVESLQATLFGRSRRDGDGSGSGSSGEEDGLFAASIAASTKTNELLAEHLGAVSASLSSLAEDMEAMTTIPFESVPYFRGAARMSCGPPLGQCKPGRDTVLHVVGANFVPDSDGVYSCGVVLSKNTTLMGPPATKVSGSRIECTVPPIPSDKYESAEFTVPMVVTEVGVPLRSLTAAGAPENTITFRVEGPVIAEVEADPYKLSDFKSDGYIDVYIEITDKDSPLEQVDVDVEVVNDGDSDDLVKSVSLRNADGKVSNGLANVVRIEAVDNPSISDTKGKVTIRVNATDHLDKSQHTERVFTVEFVDSYTSCQQAKESGDHKDGIKQINVNGATYDVYCDQNRHDGGWALMMKVTRYDGNINFKHNSEGWSRTSYGSLSDIGSGRKDYISPLYGKMGAQRIMVSRDISGIKYTVAANHNCLGGKNLRSLLSPGTRNCNGYACCNINYGSGTPRHGSYNQLLLNGDECRDNEPGKIAIRNGCGGDAETLQMGYKRGGHGNNEVWSQGNHWGNLQIAHVWVK